MSMASHTRLIFFRPSCSRWATPNERSRGSTILCKEHQSLKNYPLKTCRGLETCERKDSLYQYYLIKHSFVGISRASHACEIQGLKTLLLSLSLFRFFPPLFVVGGLPRYVHLRGTRWTVATQILPPLMGVHSLHCSTFITQAVV